jgi:aminoglycoside phosphotransferase (APT) family kinase protein
VAVAEDDVAGASRVLGRPVTFVARLTGGEHAVTTVVSDGIDEYVVRRFPPGDAAVSHEIGVLPRLAALGDFVPRLIGFDDDPAGPLIVTSRVIGAAPDPGLTPTTLATGMAEALTRIHALDGTGLRPAPSAPPSGDSPLAVRTRHDWSRLGRSATVLTHFDFWTGNALWQRDVLTGVVDWCSARSAPRGLDVAWCRLDLVLLGSVDAAEAFLARYESLSSVLVDDVAAWDRHAAAHADPDVESWSANYAGIGRPHLTGEVLRRRFDHWTQRLLAAG